MKDDWKKDPLIRISQLKFQIGDNVKLSKMGIAQFNYTPLETHIGVITGFSRNPQLISVKLHQQKSSSLYHM